MKKNNIPSLYIHIPFCISKCKYCDFFSVPCNVKVSDDYVNALCNEINVRCSKNGCELETVYVGGGTPSLLNDFQLSKILNTVKKYIQDPKQAEISIEVNPDDINEDKLKVFDKFGINRLSIGIQSMNDDVLKFAGRRAGRQENLSALNSIKKFWNNKFSVDLISALPQETEKSFIEGLNEIISYNPDHISLYSLTIEDETPFGKMYKKNLFDYDWDFADDMWLKGRDLLTKNQYFQYEISNFCKKGNYCKHNLSYWKHKNYIGCGSGACGTIYPVRWTNFTSIESYINFWKNNLNNEIPQQIEIISKETEKFEFFMMGLRLLEGVNLQEYKSFFNANISDKIINKFIEWQKKDLAKIQKSNENINLSLNEQGILFLNKFLEEI